MPSYQISCPVCEAEGRDSLQKAEPTGEQVVSGYSASRVRIAHHSNGRGEICAGSGRKV